VIPPVRSAGPSSDDGAPHPEGTAWARGRGQRHRFFLPQFSSDSGLFGLLCVVNLLNYIDRQAVTGLIEPIRRDFGASDAQMGLVGLAFLATYAFLPPLFGWLGDRVARTSVIAASATFWSVATAATALTRSVGQLAAMRAAVGVGEASYMANVPSLITDLFPPQKRGRAMSIFYTASPVGAALGVAIAGVLWSHFGWRAACVIVGLPGLLAAALIARWREPVRGRLDVAFASPVKRSIGASLQYLLRNRVFVLLTLGYAGLVFTVNAVEFWLPTVLQRDKGVPIVLANTLYGAVVLVGGITGPLLGAAIADHFRPRDRQSYFHVSALCSALLVLPLLGIVVGAARIPLFGSVLLETLIGNAPVGIVITLIVVTVAPELRSTATAVSLTTVHAIGDVISQPLVGRVSTWLQHAAPSDTVWRMLGVLGLNQGQHLLVSLISVVVPGAIVSAVMFAAAGRAAARVAEG
jgi:MFS family permease